MFLFNGKIIIGVLGNEFYFIPTISILGYSLMLKFLMWHITFNLIDAPQEEKNELSPEAQKKLDEFFEILEREKIEQNDE